MVGTAGPQGTYFAASAFAGPITFGSSGGAGGVGRNGGIGVTVTLGSATILVSSAHCKQTGSCLGVLVAALKNVRNRWKTDIGAVLRIG